MLPPLATPLLPSAAAAAATSARGPACPVAWSGHHIHAQLLAEVCFSKRAMGKTPPHFE